MRTVRGWQELTTLECNKRMPYVTSVERIGYQRGRQEEAGALVQRQLRRRFGPLAQETEDQIVALPLERVEALGEDLLDFNSLVLSALKGFEQGRMSSGKAGRLCGMGRVEFLLQASRAGVPVVDLEGEDLADEFV